MRVHDSPPLVLQYNIVFDLDDTLIYNPTHAAAVVLGSEPVNPAPPHAINAAEDFPYMRPNLERFLDLVCPYFRQVPAAHPPFVAFPGKVLFEIRDVQCVFWIKVPRLDCG